MTGSEWTRAIENVILYSSLLYLIQHIPKIDGGTVFDKEPYTLDPKKPYRLNEEIGFDAGLRLLAKTLEGNH